MKETKQKQGISLIVLVITIIIMIILAATVIISLSNSGIIVKANEAVNETNLKQVQTIANTIWVESQLTKDDPATIKNKIITAIGGETVANKYIIQVAENGVTVKIKGEDKMAPTLTITAPESTDTNNPTIVDTATYTVTGKVEDEGGVKSITVNGNEATITEDGSWSYDITLTPNETTIITIIATDTMENTTTETRYVSYVWIEPGLYQTGSNYTQLLKSWDTLISEGIITADGKIVPGNERLLSGELMISDTITTIVNDSYKDCRELTGVIIPNSVTSIGRYAFYYARLTSIIIPSSVITIGDYAFMYCSYLTSVVFEANSQLTDIGESFFNCIALTSITIPRSVTNVDLNAFKGCTKLTSITVESGNTVYHSEGNCLIETASKTLFLGFATSIIPSDGSVENIGGYAFSDCKGLTSINIPSSVITIGDRAFSGCINLTSVVFEENSKLARITIRAFANCKNLTEIIIPNTVTYIGTRAFSDCTNLISIGFKGTITQWNSISKISDWNTNVPATEVICSDGSVSL